MDDIKLALLGDKAAQERLTERGELLPCAHCKGNGKVSFKDYRFIGKNFKGDRKIVYRVQIICNKCRSRGKPIFTGPLVNPNPYITKWGNCYADTDVCNAETNKFSGYVKAAISEWNTRAPILSAQGPGRKEAAAWKAMPVKVYGQDGETICFEVQVGLAGVMVPGKGSVERRDLEDREESAWRSG